jgi:Concanavalin A-like lectin/glucanases superfamily
MRTKILLDVVPVLVVSGVRGVQGAPSGEAENGVLPVVAKPLHHYVFGDSEVADSVASANGSLMSGAVVTNGALRLNGVSAYVEFNEPLIPTSGAFSVAFFAQELSPTSDRAEIISQGKWLGPGFYIGYYPPSRNLRVGDEWQDTGVRLPDDQQWHHYALTVDEQESRFYIDGLLTTNTGSIHIATGGDNTRLGRQYEPWPEYFHGAITERWIYEGALTAQAVRALAMARPKVTSEINEIPEVSLASGLSPKTALMPLASIGAMLFVALLVLLYIFSSRRRR